MEDRFQALLHELVDTLLADQGENLGQLGSRRVRLPDGSWYWDLKPDYRHGESIEI